MKFFFLNTKILLLIGLLFVGQESFRSEAQNTAFGGLGEATLDVSHYPTNELLLPGKGPVQTWKEFPKIWAARHAEWEKTKTADRGAVVFLGDSITQKWNSLAKDFPGFHVANRGISGDTTRGVLYRLPADVNTLSPKAVVLLIGTNDLGLGADPEEVAANIREILSLLEKANPHLPIILCRVMPRSDRNLHLEEKIKRLNSFLDQITKSDSRLVACDTWTIYADAEGDCTRDEFPDLLHPNAAGYAKWSAALRPILGKLNLNSQTM